MRTPIPYFAKVPIRSMNAMANFYHSPTAPPCRLQEEGFTTTIRAVSHEARSRVGQLLGEALGDCGCWIRHRAGTASGLILIFEAPLRQMSELYPSLLESSLELDRRGRCELEMLCTLGRYALEREGLSRVVILRLEVTFADELHPSLHSTLTMHA